MSTNKAFEDMKDMFKKESSKFDGSVFFSELVATTVFFVVLLKLDDFTTNPILQPMVAGIGLFLGAMVDGSAHMNPAVSLMMTTAKKIDMKQCLVEIAAQCVAIFVAIMLVKAQKK